MRANALLFLSLKDALPLIKVSFFYLLIFPRQNSFFHFVYFHIRIFCGSFQIKNNSICLVIESQLIKQSFCIYIKVAPGFADFKCSFILRVGRID